MGNIFWMGYSNAGRHHSIMRVREIVASYGDIVDFKLFSDISVVMTLEIQERNVDDLFSKLTEEIKLDEYDRLNSTSNNERVIYLNLTFTQATGDLKVEVPSVPG